MSMNTALSENIAFSEGHASPSDDLLISVTYGQLRGLISQAVHEAIQPLQDRVSELEDMNALRAQEIAQDRHRIASLEHPEPKKLTARQEDRSKILRALLAARGGKMLMKEARQIMRMDKGAFSRLVAAMPDHIETKPFSLNKKQSILILKSSLIVDDNDQR